MLFAPLASATALVLAVSGGPDSTALLLMAARWRNARKTGPRLLAVTIDHGLRRESAGEARAVARLARALGVPHRILRWTGKKPPTGLQQNARDARYRLLAKAAARAKAGAIVTAHTLDDQAETVLIRMSRGSGLGGLGAMAREAPLPVGGEAVLVRPLLEIPKARLIATLRRARIAFADDPSNHDPRFTRARLREVMCALARARGRRGGGGRGGGAGARGWDARGDGVIERGVTAAPRGVRRGSGGDGVGWTVTRAVVAGMERASGGWIGLASFWLFLRKI